VAKQQEAPERRRQPHARRRASLRAATLKGRDFFTDVAIVVIGVFLGIVATQVVDALQWNSRVRTLQGTIRAELAGNLVNAWETQATERCAMAYIDALQAAILSQDRARVERLWTSGRPFGLRKWQDNIWNATLSTAVADHMPQQDLSTYAIIYTGVEVERQNQFQMRDLFEEAATARFELARGAAASQLASLGKLRSVRAQSTVIARALLTQARNRLGLVPDPRAIETVRRYNEGHCQRFIFPTPAA
jgi:hypothetical protein